MIRCEIAVGAVVVVQLLAEVEHAIRQGVVKEAECEPRFRSAGDIKWDVLVERVGHARAVAHRVDVGEAIALARPVHVARALAKPEIFFIPRPAQIVIDALVPPAKIIGLCRPVARHRQPEVAEP